MKRKNLFIFLINNDLTQTEVAEYLNITKQHMSLLINGNANPSFEVLEKFDEFCKKKNIEVEDMWELWKKF